MPINLTILVSGSGTTMQNLIDLIARKELDAKINLVLGSKEGLGAAELARDAGLRYEVVTRKSFDSIEAFSMRIFSRCTEASTDLVVCAGWLALLRLDPRFQNRVINIHPALLPSFGGKGMYGRYVHEAVLAHGCKVTGCTVHFVDDQYDNGPIILQRGCAIPEGASAEEVASRVGEQERIALPEAIRLIHAGRVRVAGRRVRIAGS